MAQSLFTLIINFTAMEKIAVEKQLVGKNIT